MYLCGYRHSRIHTPLMCAQLLGHGQGVWAVVKGLTRGWGVGSFTPTMCTCLDMWVHTQVSRSALSPPRSLSLEEADLCSALDKEFLTQGKSWLVPEPSPRPGSSRISCLIPTKGAEEKPLQSLRVEVSFLDSRRKRESSSFCLVQL